MRLTTWRSYSENHQNTRNQYQKTRFSFWYPYFKPNTHYSKYVCKRKREI